MASERFHELEAAATLEEGKATLRLVEQAGIEWTSQRLSFSKENLSACMN